MLAFRRVKGSLLRGKRLNNPLIAMQRRMEEAKLLGRSCRSVKTRRCKDECSCEQKYKWHRLLAYDPDDDCKGIFMDWFLFPSCCVCRCPNPLLGK